MNNNIRIAIEKDEYSYYTYSPELRGCQTQGDTLDEAILNIREAIELYLDTLDDDERKECLSKEIYTTNLEIKVA